MARRPVGFRVKLLASYLALVVLAAGVGVVVLDRVLGAELEEGVERRLESQVAAVVEWVGVAGRPERLANKLAEVVDGRVVVLTRDGEVLGDSAPAEGELVGLADDVRAGRLGDARLAVRRAGGREYLTAVGPIDVERVVAIAVARAVIEAPRQALRRWLAAIAALGFAVALVLGVVMTRLVARPLRRMVASAERVGAGDYRVDPPSDSPDELGLLSRALSSLAEQVRARIADVERERDLLGAVLSSLAEGVVAVARGGAVRLANPAAARIAGAEVGRPLAAPFAELAATAESSGERVERELEDGDRALAVTAIPLAAVGGAVVVVHDLTRVRRLETVRRDFVANLSHELRTPVTSIRGYAETLAAGVPDAATRDEFIAVIQRNAVRIGRLVDDLLVLQELDARPRDQLESDRVELAGVAGEVARTVGPAAVAAGMRVEVDVPAGLVALADADGLERVVLNLVDNAIKYAAAGGVVRVAARAVDGGGIELIVEDRGPGIPAEARDHVFERFFRLDPGRAREQGGTGLGLAIVRDLVRSMGGRVRVDAADPRGARLIVELRDTLARSTHGGDHAA